MGFQVTEVQKALKGADYPASRDELVQLAASNGASEDLLGALRSLEGDSFDGPDKVMQGFKGELGGG